MKLAGVIGSFTVSLALFIFSYLTIDNGYGWLLFGVGGIIFAVIGAYIAMSKGDEQALSYFFEVYNKSGSDWI